MPTDKERRHSLHHHRLREVHLKAGVVTKMVMTTAASAVEATALAISTMASPMTISAWTQASVAAAAVVGGKSRSSQRITSLSFSTLTSPCVLSAWAGDVDMDVAAPVVVVVVVVLVTVASAMLSAVAVSQRRVTTAALAVTTAAYLQA